MPSKYHDYEELTSELHNINEKWPALTKLYSLSEKSVENRSIWVLQISTDVSKNERKELKPMVKYIGNIHGNEAVGRELLLHFAKYLLNKYTSSSSNDLLNIRDLIASTDIHILPSMNPDGFERSKQKDCDGLTGMYAYKGVTIIYYF